MIRFVKLMQITIEVASLIIISLTLSTSSFGDSGNTASYAPNPKERSDKHFKWMIFPAIFYSSDSGLGGAVLFAGKNTERRSFNFGINYAGREKQVYELLYTQKNVFMTKDRLEIEVNLAKDEKKFYNLIEKTRHDVIGSYQREKVSGKLTWQKKFATAWEYGASYQFSDFQYFDVLPVENASLFDREIVNKSSQEMSYNYESSISPFLINDTRDDELNSSRGRYYNFHLLLARKKIGSKDNFTKLGLDLRNYFNPGDVRHIFALRGRVGYSTGDVPYHTRYDLGGKNSMRGYPSKRFIGARELLFNAEYRLTLLKGLPNFIPNMLWDYGIVLFIDIGRAWNKGDNLFSLDDFNISYGIGKRIYFPPVIVLRLDYGIAGRGTNTGFYFHASHLF